MRCKFIPPDCVLGVDRVSWSGIMHLNVHSLLVHLDELEILVSNLNAPLIIGLSEPWLKPENENLCGIPGYTTVSNARTEKAGGGVALLILDEFRFIWKPELDSNQTADVEYIFIEIQIRQTTLIIGVIYPSSKGLLEYLYQLFRMAG